MKQAHALMVVTLIAVSPMTPLRGQEQTAVAPTPATKLEQLLSGKDRVVTKEFFALGTVNGLAGAAATFEAVALTEASNERVKIKGIRIEIKETSRLERTHASFLDQEEIGDLSKSLAYFSDIASKWAFSQPGYAGAGNATPIPTSREATFTSRGEFQIGLYRTATGSEGAVMQSGSVGRTTILITIPDLAKLKDIVDKGNDLLKVIG